MNTLSIICRLTRDPETKFTPTGKAITSFGIAWDMGYGDSKRPCFIDCKLWGDRGEKFAQYVKKGHQVALTCQLDMESWEDKQSGQKRTKHTLDVRDFTLLTNKRDGEQERQAPQQQRPAQRQAPRQQAPVQQQQESAESVQGGMEDDDIPF